MSGMLALHARRRSDTGKGADLDDVLLEHEGASGRAKHAVGAFLGARQIVWMKHQRNREFVATEARGYRIGPELVGQRAGDALEQAIASLIAVLVVDRLEAIDLERDDGRGCHHSPPPSASLSASLSAKPSLIPEFLSRVSARKYRRPFLFARRASAPRAAGPYSCCQPNRIGATFNVSAVLATRPPHRKCRQSQNAGRRCCRSR